MFLLEPQKEPKRVPLLPIARGARLKGACVRALHERFAKRALKNPRKVGLAAARRRFLCNGIQRAKVQSIFGPEGGNMEGDGKALRKMQHSCIF